MTSFEWAGYFLGWALMSTPFALAALLLVPRFRRSVGRGILAGWRNVAIQVLRHITGRSPHQVAAWTAALEAELRTGIPAEIALAVNFTVRKYVPISYMNIEQQLQRGRGASPPDNITLR